jgi:AcrR family transcriptional regulator
VSERQARPSTWSRLLDAVIETVARDGYADTTVAQLLDYAGASRSTFYEYFNDKDECFIAAAEEIGARLVVAVEHRTSTEEPQRVPLGAAETLLEFALEEDAKARVLFTELLAGGSRAQDLRDGLIDRLAAIIEDAWRRGAGKTPTHDLPARALVGGVFRLLSFRMRRGASGLHELQPAVLTWVNAYSRQDGLAQWQSTAALEALQPHIKPPVVPIMPPPPLPNGRRGLPASEIARNHRDRLLHATATGVYQKGYAAVAVSDIVRTAGVSRGVFYNHFRDKQAAVMEAMQLTFEMSMAVCAGAFFATSVVASGWPAQLWAGACALSDYYAAAPALVYLAFVESYAVGSASIQLVEERMMAFTLLLEQGYHHLSEAQSPPRQISQIIAFATFELAYREVRQRQPGKFSHLLPQLAYMNLAPFLGAEDATSFVHDGMRELGF